MGLTRIRAEQISNIDYKQAVRVVSTANVTLSGGAPVVVDGVTLVQGNRVLVTGQTTGSQNGIYVVQTLGTGEDGTWIRATDANQTGEIEPGMVVMVTEGTTYADTPWKLITNGNIIIGTTALTFQQFSSGANVGGVDTNIQFNSSGNLAGSSNFTWDGTELYVNAAANITGNVTGNYFFGNGSQLSGIITSVANINNGTSNVSIAEANANITMSVDGTADVVVVSAAGMTVNGNITGNGIPTTTVANTAPVSPAQGDVWIDSDTGTQLIYFTSGGNSQWAEMEADQSFSYYSTGTNYGDSNVAAYLPTYSGNIGDGTGYVFGNGSQLVGLPAGYTNSNVISLLSNFGSNTISTTGNVTAGNVITGNIVVRTDSITSANSTITIDPSAVGITGLVIIAGNLQVQGTTTTIDSTTVTVNDLVFNVANNASTASQANNAGIAVGPVGSEYATLLYNNANGSWKSNLPIETTGNITAGYFIGNGSQLTGLPASYGNANVVTLLASFGSNTISTTGNITGGNLTTAGTLTAATIVETSSIALKENIRPLADTNPLDAILQLAGQIYDRRDGSQKDETGLIAEDVFKIIPALVGLDDQGNPASVRYSRLTVYLLEAIKSLKEEIDTLKNQR